MNDEILTSQEIATLLKIKEKAAYDLVARGECPNFKIGRSWHVPRLNIEVCIAEKPRKASR